MRKQLALLYLFIFGLAVFGEAQQPCLETIRGRVFDENDGPLFNAFVSIDNESTVTKTDGTFSIVISCAKAHQLSVRFVGYKTITESVVANRVVDIHLKPDQQQLEEVVIEAIAESPC